MARFSRGKVRKEKTSEKRTRKLANRSAKENAKLVGLGFLALCAVVVFVVWMASNQPKKSPANEAIIEAVKKTFEEKLKQNMSTKGSQHESNQ